MQQYQAIMSAKGKGKGSWKPVVKPVSWGSSSWNPVIKPQFSKPQLSKKSWGVVAGDRLGRGSAKNFDASQRVWIGGLTPEVTEADLQELCDTVGTCELVQIHGKSGSAVACFQTSHEAQMAIATLNGSAAGDIVLQFDSWTSGERVGGGSKRSGRSGGSGDPAQNHLVDRIKNFQRMDEDQKQAWWDFCDAHLEGRRDPAKAETSVLQNFCDTNGVPDIAQQNWKGGGGSTGDEALDGLVARIKAYQRSDEAQKQAWWTFCDENLGGKKDPTRADVATLLSFCDINEVP